jgi:sigma-B regulation protein RsbU (phosphoserine phosphatase)
LLFDYYRQYDTMILIPVRISKSVVFSSTLATSSYQTARVVTPHKAQTKKYRLNQRQCKQTQASLSLSSRPVCRKSFQVNALEIESKRDELEQLRRENAAYRAQGKLLEGFVAMIRSPAEGGMLKACLQQTLDLATELTGAERSSIFLLDENGVVTDSILARQDSVKDEGQLIGSIMNKGLAGWAYKHNACGVVHDTDNDARWLPLKNQPFPVGSALAAPIGRSENLFGILTLSHSHKNHFSQDLIEAMQAMADQIALVLENVKLYMELAKAKSDVEVYSTALNQELEKGRKIQEDFLPAHIPPLPNLEYAAKFVPALQVSGDFYDAFLLPGGLIGLVIGDVSDKGVGAALYMALIRSFIRMFSAHNFEKEERNESWPKPLNTDILHDFQFSSLKALTITNDYLESVHDTEGMFATVFFGIINPQNGMISYINAGHPPVYVISHKGGYQHLGVTGPAIGLQGGTWYRVKTYRLQPNDILFGYTDGVTEALSPSVKMYGTQRLEHLITRHPFKSAKALMLCVYEDLIGFVDSAPQSDDITMIAAQWQP